MNENFLNHILHLTNDLLSIKMEPKSTHEGRELGGKYTIHFIIKTFDFFLGP
jgi:hypothetical protein